MKILWSLIWLLLFHSPIICQRPQLLTFNQTIDWSSMNSMSLSQWITQVLLQNLDSFLLQFSTGLKELNARNISLNGKRNAIPFNDLYKNQLPEEVDNIQGLLKPSEHSAIESPHSALVKREDLIGRLDTQYLIHQRPNGQLKIIKRNEMPSSDCSGVGLQALTQMPQYNCNGTIKSQKEMDQNKQTLVSCDDCGKSDPGQQATVGNQNGGIVTSQYNTNLTLSPQCPQMCCNKTDTPLMTYGCACPMDRFGDSCQYVYPWSCSIQLMDPLLPCSDVLAPYDLRTQIYSSDQCQKFSQFQENINLSFQINCAQIEPLVPNSNQTQEQEFQYFVKTDNNTFALSSDPRIYLQLKIYNFYRLRDNDQTGYIQVTPQMLTGQQYINFSLNLLPLHALKNLDDRVDYMVGGRVYMEAAFASLSQIQGLSQVPYTGFFLDFYDLPEPSPFERGMLGVWLGVGLGLGFFILLIVIVLFFRRNHQKKLKLA